MTDEQISRTLTAATKAATRKLGAAWDSMPCLRNGAVALEILVIIAAKDTDTATAKTAHGLIALASDFIAQTVTD